jgi:hypothetical protein
MRKVILAVSKLISGAICIIAHRKYHTASETHWRDEISCPKCKTNWQEI